ncbi:MAG: hypothetical protein GQ544_06335 [Candidatus Aminicenantes bacterium]|nr:hypothetical protein [Candidatus Aminicenantes bacterium]
MENILELITLSRALGAALVLASIWLMAIIIKKQRQHLFRGFMFFLVLLAAFLYVSNSDNSNLTINSLIHQLFPTKPLVLNYRTSSTEGAGGSDRIIYRFDDPRPRLEVSLDDKGKYSHITNPESLNRILRKLGLPEVKEGARELASITGTHLDGSIYLWKDYPRGILRVEKVRFQGRDTLVAYDCVAKIIVSSRY